MNQDCTFGEQNQTSEEERREDQHKSPRERLASPSNHGLGNSAQFSATGLKNSFALRPFMNGNMESIERVNQHLTRFPLNHHPDELSSKMGTASKAFINDYERYIEPDSTAKPLVRQRLVSQSLDRGQPQLKHSWTPTVAQFQLPAPQQAGQLGTDQFTFIGGGYPPKESLGHSKNKNLESTEATRSNQIVTDVTRSPAEATGMRADPRHQRCLSESTMAVRRFELGDATISGKPVGNWGLTCYPAEEKHRETQVPKLRIDHPNGSGQRQDLQVREKSPIGIPQSTLRQPQVPTSLQEKRFQTSELPNSQDTYPDLFPNKSLAVRTSQVPKRRRSVESPITLSNIGPLLDAEEFLLVVYELVGMTEANFGWERGGSSSNPELRLNLLWHGYQQALSRIKAFHSDSQ